MEIGKLVWGMEEWITVLEFGVGKVQSLKVLKDGMGEGIGDNGVFSDGGIGKVEVGKGGGKW